MYTLFQYIAIYLTPILSIVFCINLVSILKKVNKNEEILKNTLWLSISFLLIIWSMAYLLAFSQIEG